MSQELLERTAVHEAGHIVMAYLLGYSCNFTDCSAMTPGEGRSEIKWTPIHQLVNFFLQPNLFHLEIKSLTGFGA
jgi:hypothetical protein